MGEVNHTDRTPAVTVATQQLSLLVGSALDCGPFHVSFQTAPARERAACFRASEAICGRKLPRAQFAGSAAGL